MCVCTTVLERYLFVMDTYPRYQHLIRMIQEVKCKYKTQSYIRHQYEVIYIQIGLELYTYAYICRRISKMGLDIYIHEIV